MKRREQIAITAVVVAALLGPLVLMLAGVRPDVDENRELTQAPALDAASAVDESTWSQMGDFLTDRIPMRDHAISLDSDLRERVNFSDVADDGTPRGKDGWLFHPDTLLDDCLGPKPKAFFDKGDRIPERAERAGVDFLFVVIPDKVVVYPEHQATEGLTGVLGLADDGAGLPDCVQTWADALAEEAPSREWVWNLGPELAAAADATDEPLYYLKDTHWTNRGALLYVEGLVNHFSPGMFDPSEVAPSGEQIVRGDLARIKGTGERESQPELVVTRPGVTFGEVEISDDDRRAMQVLHSSASTTDAPLIEGTTVILGDSFTRRALPLLVPYFEEIVFLQRPYLADHTVGEALEGRTADRLVIGEVQRNVAKGWFEDFMQAANQHLVHEQH